MPTWQLFKPKAQDFVIRFSTVPTPCSQISMASSPSSTLLPLGSASGIQQGISSDKIRSLVVRCLNGNISVKEWRMKEYGKEFNLTGRREMIGLVCGMSSFVIDALNAKAAGLPPEDKPKLCDNACEKELENVPMVTTESGLQYKDIKVGGGPSPPVGFQVAANYVAMIPSGQIFDSSLEKNQLYIFRVGSGQVIKGLDEGILSMKVGGKRRLYIPGSLAFPKGLTSAPGRPRVAPNSPVVFDVSLEYIPGLEEDEE
ncbi:peptidyl-prolyl cis-trans isomerase FKBP16-3, chloroplastic isoform X1 [Benincasa hispida]|uniref:peptidyl-prolyl cis-trans isomerase FKBP16-3, chloroplastic isoform X1 n=1 Tax=Benincasa hispida TaxID=102211 RepID=UPI0018FF5798|nr:peptidyl-prolyl cis-trans isomerase FKBP16-3, chloroplastic isoform X1 [Benincasa hispida]